MAKAPQFLKVLNDFTDGEDIDNMSFDELRAVVREMASVIADLEEELANV